MSRAIDAKNASERANILCAMMRRKPSAVSRGMSDCLEMGDGEEVIRIVRQRIANGAMDYDIARRYLSAEACGPRPSTPLDGEELPAECIAEWDRAARNFAMFGSLPQLMDARVTAHIEAFPEAWEAEVRGQRYALAMNAR